MSQSSSSTESDTLRHRIEDTEREKRDLVGVVSRLKEDSAQREGSSNFKFIFVTYLFCYMQRKYRFSGPTLSKLGRSIKPLRLKSGS